MDNNTCMIDERESKNRLEIIAFLEENGYRRANEEFRTKDEIIESAFPLVVNKSEKSYWMLGNVTCAAAAVSGGGMIKKEDFYERINC